MKPLLSALCLALAVGCAADSGTTTTPQDNSSDARTTNSPDAPPSGNEIRGLKSLYMGHSYFRRQAENMNEYAEAAGIEGHDSVTIFHGGYKGSAAAIWEDVVPGSKETVEGHLNAGDIEMLGMTLFIDLEAPEGDVRHLDSQIQGLKNWIEYARAKNPDTMFFVGLPWLGRPLDYVGDTGDPQTSGYEEYRAAVLQSEEFIKPVIDELRATFPDSEIFLLAYGQGSVELRTLYNAGNLPDVDTLVSDGDLVGIHSDTHGHATQILTDLNSLIWLQSIYGVNVLEFEKEYPYLTDINQIAYDVATRQDSAYTRQFE